MDMGIEKLSAIQSQDFGRVAQIVALYQAAVASQIEEIRQQKREALVATVVALIQAILVEIRSKGTTADLLIGKIYRLLEIIALLGIGDRPEIVAQITKLRHVAQIYLRIQMDLTGLLNEVRAKGPVHSPKMLEIKLAQLFQLVEMRDEDKQGVQMEVTPGIDLARFKDSDGSGALNRLKSGVTDLAQMPMIRKYHKKATEIMMSLPTPKGFLLAMANVRRRRSSVSVTK